MLLYAVLCFGIQGKLIHIIFTYKVIIEILVKWIQYVRFLISHFVVDDEVGQVSRNRSASSIHNFTGCDSSVVFEQAVVHEVHRVL